MPKVRSNIRRSALAAVAVLCMGSVLSDIPSAYAHGEGTQQSWVRTTTSTFFDMEYSGDVRKLDGDRGYELDVGASLKVTGKVKISDQFPAVLGGFGLGHIGLLMPGPVLAMHNITVNGAFTPGSVTMKPGDVFTFEMDLVGRRPGRYHIHPRIDLKAKGPTVGAGVWVRVNATGKPYKHDVMLTSGKSVDIESYAAGTVYSYQILWLVLALVFVVGFFRKKRLLSRLSAVRRGLDDGPMISPRDRKFAGAMGLIALLVIVGSNAYASSEWKTIPLQVRRESVPVYDVPHLADAVMQRARYEKDGEHLRLVIDVKSAPDATVHIERLVMGSVSLAAKPYYSASEDELLTPEPNQPVPAGGTQRYTFDISAHKLNEERLLFTNSAVAQIGGLLIVRSDDGRRSWVNVVADLVKE